MIFGRTIAHVLVLVQCVARGGDSLLVIHVAVMISHPFSIDMETYMFGRVMLFE